MRSSAALFLILLFVFLNGGIARAERPAQGQITWRGIYEWESAFAHGNKEGHGTGTANWTFIEEIDDHGNSRYISRTVDWGTQGEASLTGGIGVDMRSKLRVPSDYHVSCGGGGHLDYGASSDIAAMDRASDMLHSQHPTCVESPSQDTIEVFGEPGAPHWTGPPNVGPVDWSELEDDCSYSREIFNSPGDGFWERTRESIWVSYENAGALEVDPSTYDAFVPGFGKTISFEAKSSTPVLFRFALPSSKTSAFFGGTTNFSIYSGFLTNIQFAHLEGIYTDKSPDLFFDPYNFKDRSLWADSSFDQVETKKESTSVTVTVTSMDTGGVGELKGWAKGKCGVWEPLVVKIGNTSGESIPIPRDIDHNFIADSLEMYRDLPPDADRDDEPKGDGTAGDGLTAFEEYRGFFTRGERCFDPDTVVRTDPRKKDLFIDASNGPRLAMAVQLFGVASDLTVHLLCDGQYYEESAAEADFRMKHNSLNFTLQNANQREWQGKKISQAEPQHIISIGHQTRMPTAGFAGRAFPNSDNPDTLYFGPPKLTSHVWVDWNLDNHELYFTAIHELGHAVGIPHHSDHLVNRQAQGGNRNIETQFSVIQATGSSVPAGGFQESPESLLVDPGPDCEATSWRSRYKDGKFVGCIADRIARQGGQNSGNADCPMRYTEAEFHEVKGSNISFAWSGPVTLLAEGEGNMSRNVHAWSGPTRRYHGEEEELGMGKFCSASAGTKLNALPGDENHAGDLGRDKPCAEHIVINDLVIPGIP